MSFRFFKMGFEGKVAVANLASVGACLLVILLEAHLQSDAWRSAGAVAEKLMVVLAFPVGWLSFLASTVSGPPLMEYVLLTIFLPLNAFLWGYTAAAAIQWRRRRKA